MKNFLAWILVAIAGCNVGGQTGSPSADPCGHQEVTPLDGLDEVAPNGERGADVLAVADGSRAAVAEWETGEITDVSIAVAYEGGTVQFRETESPECPDGVEVEVALDVSTSDGAVDAATTCALSAGAAGEVHCGTWLDGVPDPGEPGQEAPPPVPQDLFLAWTGDGVTGQIVLGGALGTGCVRAPDGCTPRASETVAVDAGAFVAQGREVARSAEEWDAITASLFAAGAAPQVSVDWATEMVVVEATDACEPDPDLVLSDCADGVHSRLVTGADCEVDPTDPILGGAVAITARADGDVFFSERTAGTCE